MDVGKILIAYLFKRTKDWWKSTSLFVLHSRNNKGKPASKSTIARWIMLAIQLAYQVHNLGIKAHSTRAWVSSVAERAGATLKQIVRAATWSSFKTPLRHYRIHRLCSQDQTFGHKVLQALLPPPPVNIACYIPSGSALENNWRKPSLVPGNFLWEVFQGSTCCHPNCQSYLYASVLKYQQTKFSSRHFGYLGFQLFRMVDNCVSCFKGGSSLSPMLPWKTSQSYQVPKCFPYLAI